MQECEETYENNKKRKDELSEELLASKEEADNKIKKAKIKTTEVAKKKRKIHHWKKLKTCTKYRRLFAKRNDQFEFLNILAIIMMPIWYHFYAGKEVKHRF